MNRPRHRFALVRPALLTVATTLSGSSVALAQTAPPAAAVTASNARLHASVEGAAPQADTLSIGPGLFTFPQIAALLSTPEQPIVCDVSMKDRAAFVFLQNRPRVEVKELLGAGLQVEFAPEEIPAGLVVTTAAQAKTNPVEKPQPLLMIRQKAVAEREADWLKRAARLLQTEMDRRIAEVLSYANKPMPDWEKSAKLAREAEVLEKEIGPPYKKPPTTDAMTQKRARLAALTAAYRAEEKVPDREARLGAAWARTHPPALIPLIQGKRNTYSLAPVPMQGMESDWIAQSLAEKANKASGLSNANPPAGFSPETYDLVAGYQAVIRSNGMGVSAQGSLVHQTGIAFGQKIPLVPGYDAKQSDALWGAMKQLYGLGFSFERPRNYTGVEAEADAAETPNLQNESIPAVFTLLGSEAVAWWKQEQADTLSCLKDLASDTPLPAVAVASVPLKETLPHLYDRLRDLKQVRQLSLSDALEGWTARTQTEAIMELHPRVELWETWEPYPAPDALVKAGALFLPLSAWIHNGEVADQWSVRQQNNVLLITSRMEFIERPQNTPLPELIQLQSDLHKWYGEHSAVSVPDSPRDNQAFMPYEPLAAYTRAVLARRDGRTWDAVPTLADYHNTYFHHLDSTVLALFLWGKLSKKEQARLLTPPGKAQAYRVSLPLSQFGQAALNTLMELMREAGGDTGNTLLPKYQAQLRNSRLELEVNAARDSAALPLGCRAVRISFREGDDWTVGPDPNLGAQILLPIRISEKAAP